MASCDHDSDNVHTVLQIEMAMAYPCTCSHGGLLL